VTRILEPGSELEGGKYRIVRLLGAGGMGSVFEAEHRDTQRRVAIKCVHPSQGSEPEVAQRLVREAQAAARVRHPNVVDVYDVGRDGSMVYLVMEFLEGEPLSRPLARRDMPMHTIISLLIAAMRGVSAVHRQGVVHRDLKPDNIFLAKVADFETPVPKILDFGISKVEARGQELRSLTRSGTTVGTPSYMSYEQLAGETPIDGRTDVYAFGVILYEALTGKLPYEADTFTELIARFSTQTPLAPSELRPEIPHTLSRVIMWALAREREQRIPTVDALIRELEPFSTRHGIEAELTLPAHTPPLARTPVPPPAYGYEATPRPGVVVNTPAPISDESLVAQATQRTGTRTWVIAGGVVLVGAALVAMFALARGRNAPAPEEALVQPAPAARTRETPRALQEPQPTREAPRPNEAPALPLQAEPLPEKPLQPTAAAAPDPQTPSAAQRPASALATNTEQQPAPHAPKKKRLPTGSTEQHADAPPSPRDNKSSAKPVTAPRDLGIY